MYGPYISAFGLEMLKNDFDILIDNITCPDKVCRKPAVLTKIGRNLVYVCSDNCYIAARKRAERPYWDCKRCGGDGGLVAVGNGSGMCECWLPEPLKASYRRSDVPEPLFV